VQGALRRKRGSVVSVPTGSPHLYTPNSCSAPRDAFSPRPSSFPTHCSDQPRQIFHLEGVEWRTDAAASRSRSRALGKRGWRESGATAIFRSADAQAKSPRSLSHSFGPLRKRHRPAQTAARVRLLAQRMWKCMTSLKAIRFSSFPDSTFAPSSLPLLLPRFLRYLFLLPRLLRLPLLLLPPPSLLLLLGSLRPLGSLQHRPTELSFRFRILDEERRGW
jgi:hypothetical protein